MLASLLPGLREVRTPLATGYLWLFVAWLALGDALPRVRPAGDGFIPRVFDVVQAVDPAARLVVLSFAAYVVGALLTISTDNPVLRLLFQSGLDFFGPAKQIRKTYDDYIAAALSDVQQRSSALEGTDRVVFDDLVDEVRGERQELDSRSEFKKLVADARRTGRLLPIADLGIRLLTVNQELYGEYDRLTAEAELRINLWLPLQALAIAAGSMVHFALGVSIFIFANGLSLKGVHKAVLAAGVLQRAVVVGIIPHPVLARLEWLVERADPRRK